MHTYFFKRRDPGHFVYFMQKICPVCSTAAAAAAAAAGAGAGAGAGGAGGAALYQNII